MDNKENNNKEVINSQEVNNLAEEAVEEILDKEAVEEILDEETVEEVLDTEAVEEVLDTEAEDEILTEEPVEEILDEEAAEEVLDTEETVEEVPTEEAVEEILDAEAEDEILDEEIIEEDSQKEGSYVYQGDGSLKPKKVSVAKIALTIGTVVVLIAGIILSVIFFTNKGVKADTMKLKGYEFQTLKGFTESDKVALSYNKSTGKEEKGNHVFYRYSLNDYTFEDVNAYIESFIEEDNLYVTDKGEYVAYFFKENDVLELFFYQENEEIGIEWYVYDYIAADFDWMIELEASNAEDLDDVG